MGVAIAIIPGLQAMNPPPVKTDLGDELNGVVSGLALYIVGAAGMIAFFSATLSWIFPSVPRWVSCVLQGLNLVAVYLTTIAGLIVLRVVQVPVFGS